MWTFKHSYFKNSGLVRYVFIDSKNIQWEGVVGLEVHAQINTNSKLFSGAGTAFIGGVNDQVSYFDAAIPGTLPILNKECVYKGILTALALNCTIHPVSWFDRKHYFYADLPAGYQITQQRFPLATNGLIEFPAYSTGLRNKSYMKISKIKQIQLEQDSGRSIHDNTANKSLVDLNRAGNPLMELVFEPDLKNGDEAACLVRELILVLKKLQTCSCKIEEGALRIDANISVRKIGSMELGTRTEVKNINGILNILKAVNFEVERQIRLKKAGREIVNETRAWDADVNRTVKMRDKEVEQDYRFMPEPNLPPLKVSLDKNEGDSDLINVPIIRKQLPELPATFRENLQKKHNLSVDIMLRLLERPVLLDLFLEIMHDNEKRNSGKIANYILMDLLSALNKADIEVEDFKFDAKRLGELYDLFSNQIINRVILTTVLDKLIAGEKESPTRIVEKEQLYQINDRPIIEEACKLAFEFNKEWVETYYNSKKLLKQKHYRYLFNEILQNTQGRANLQLTKDVLDNFLEKNKPKNESYFNFIYCIVDTYGDLNETYLSYQN